MEKFESYINCKLYNVKTMRDNKHLLKC